MTDSSTTDQPSPTRRGLFSWALYDWANSSFAAIISTFVFPAYFASQVALDETAGTAQWGWTVGIAGLLVALGAPILGAIADQAGGRKPWLAGFTGLCVLATAALWFIEPDHSWLMQAMLLAGLATLGAEFAFVFYNAMLPSLTSFERLGRWSGWAWGLGYIGGIGCLLLALFGFVREPAWFGVPQDNAEHVRATFVLVAVWYAVFALPLLLFTPDEPRRMPLARALGRGLAQLRDSIRHVRDYAHILRFLLARMIFIDGLATIFSFGGVYVAGTFDFSQQQVLLFGIALNVTAGIGAVSFAWIDDWLGSKTTILLSLVGLMIPGTWLLVTESTHMVWVLGAILGIFVGPVQAASRSYLSRTAPQHLRSEMFGLFAFSGKATAFLGPLLVGWVTTLFDSQRAGMGVVIVLLCSGFLLMLTVPAAGKKPT